MASENELKQYLKTLIKDYESTVLADDRYRTGDLDLAFIHQQFSPAVGKFLKASQPDETAKMKEPDRLYYRGWIAAYSTLMLTLERQRLRDLERESWDNERVAWEKERAGWDKERAAEEKERDKEREKHARELERAQDKLEKLQAKLDKVKKK